MKKTFFKILHIGTDRSEQTVQTQIRLLLKEQSDLGQHCFSFHLQILNVILPLYKNSAECGVSLVSPLSQKRATHKNLT